MYSEKIKKAIEDLHNGKFVLIFDFEGREEETDFVMAASFTKPEDVRRMRKEGGGLIFLMVEDALAKKLGLPFLSELFYREGNRYPVLKELIPNDIPYDTKSSFSVTINHRKTFTGITDKDRALTIREFGLLATRLNQFQHDVDAQREFGSLFRAPGHVPICRASEKPLQRRKGHTELSVTLLTLAGLTPVAVGCEMMYDDGNSLPKEKARRYGEKHGFVFLEGKEIVEAWKEYLKIRNQM
ncbi:MAG TPA: 3,4-dihydroxy-2-butanone-4-phosphate synthase [Thermoplasmata archaeon]|nr:3,4-dihydroxy-2-butanone-4-phosphate synthase [Thermoplasmata archaeon]